MPDYLLLFLVYKNNAVDRSEEQVRGSLPPPLERLSHQANFHFLVAQHFFPYDVFRRRFRICAPPAQAALQCLGCSVPAP